MPLLKTPTGETISLPDEQVGSAIASGYQPVDVGEGGIGNPDKPDTGALGGLFAGTTGLLSGASLGLSDVIGSQFASPGGREFVQQAREQHPITTGGTEFLGALLPSLAAPGSGLARTPAGATSSLGRSIVEATTPEGAGLARRVLGHATGAAAEGALYGGGDYLSQAAIEDKPLTAEGFVGAMGHGALFGGSLGGGMSLGGEALIRARNLFPRSQISAAAAQGIETEAKATLKQAVTDGYALSKAAESKIAEVDAKVGLAQHGEQHTRAAFGGADPQSLADQAVGGVDKVALQDALQEFEASKVKLNDWLAGDIEESLSNLTPEGVQSNFGKSMHRSDAVWPPEASEVGGDIAGFGADLVTGAKLKKVPSELLAEVNKPTRERAVPLSNEEFESYKKDYGHASESNHFQSEMYYSKGGDEELNGALRAGKDVLNIPNSNIPGGIKGLDSAMELPESRIPRDTELYRGLSGDWAKNHFSNMKPGDVFEEPGYMSTAHNADSKVRNEDVVFNIQTPAGTKGVPIRSKFSGEKEILLQRGIKFRVDKNELIPQVPNETRWKSSIGHEVNSDKSVTVEFGDGSKHTYPPIRELNVTIVNDISPSPKKADRVVNTDVPVANLNRQQLKQYIDLLEPKLDELYGKPEREPYMAKREEARQRLLAIDDDKIPNPSPAKLSSTDHDLESLLRGTKEKIDAGQTISQIGHESRLPLPTPHEPMDIDSLMASMEGKYKLPSQHVMSSDEEAVSKLLSKKHGSNVDIGPDLSKAAQAIGGYEASSAKLTDLLGKDAPLTSQMHAKDYQAAVAKGADATGASSERLANDIKAKAPQGVVDQVMAQAKGKDGGGLSAIVDTMKALGIAHIATKIPVIGPILGLFLKAKAVVGIMGKKGGSVGRTAEGMIASKAAATQDRIVKATTKLLDVGIKATKTAEHMAGPAVLLKDQLFPGKKTKGDDPVDLFNARIDEISRAQQPGAVAMALSDRLKISDPHLQDAISQQIQRGIDFLAKKAPRETVLPGMIPGDGKWRPGKAAINEFAKYVHAVNDPASVLEDLANGHFSMEGAEVLRIVYPNLYAQAQKALMEHAAELQKTLPYPRRVALSIMYQLPMDSSMTPTHMTFLQPPPVPVAPPTGPGAPQAGPAMTGPLQIGQQTMTAFDRRAGQ